MILYRLFLLFYPLLAKLISPFNEKAKHWVAGQQKVWDEVGVFCSQIKGPIIWVHCASYGEFEQGFPIISALKKTYPTHQIWVTFFSPSGYLHRKHHPDVDFVSYLPMDGPTAATRWMEMVQPKCIVFIKYEFWYYYLKLAAENKIPAFLAAAIFRPDQIFFKFYGGFYRTILQLFTGILVQDVHSKNLISPLLKDTHLHISGDTRFDRVLDIAANKIAIDWVPKLADGKIIVTGSTWEDDHKIIGPVSEQCDQLEQCNWIIVPHNVDTASIKACQSHFTNSICLSEWLTQSNSTGKPLVLIVDQIGLLSQLYQYADIAYIGGGFTKDGIHNVLEAAVFGKPVLWGPNDLKYPEAIGLRNGHGGIKIKDASTLNGTINQLLNDASFSKATGDAALKYVQVHAGATQKTIEYIKQIYVSPIDQKL
jgi:3-deoxy-D-manno-octulosonic-acid transferase